jgi:Leucine-rich repeat (LRR) protein
MDNIVCLNANNNKIKKIPKSMPMLNYLYISNNKLVRVPVYENTLYCEFDNNDFSLSVYLFDKTIEKLINRKRKIMKFMTSALV